MLVKIIALGLSPAIWKNVFHHLRNSLPDHPFAAGIFSSAEEIEFLTGEFFPHHWRREQIDLLLCEAGTGSNWHKRLAFLREVIAEQSAPPVALVLTLSTLEHGIKQLIQAEAPVQLQLDNQSRFTVSDPAFIVRRFPREFPRVQVDGHIRALRLRNQSGRSSEVTPSALPPGSLIGFSEIESVVGAGEALPPADWLKATLRAEKIRLPRNGSPGLIRETNGIFLCPGIPIARVTGASLGGIAFPYLLDLGQLSTGSRQFSAVRDAVRRAGNRHSRQWRETTARTRLAEAKADLPIVCGGGLPLVRETFAALLKDHGFQRCSTLASPAEGTFREPALLLQVGAWDGAEPGAQVEEPHLVPLADELLPLFAPLDGVIEWQALPYRPYTATAAPLTPESFAEQLEQLAARRRKARDGLSMAEKRGLLLEQELQVLGAAKDKLAELLEARAALQVWTGALPRGVRQAVVFSHDQEEAGAVMQALAGIAKKRWFDLSPYRDADALRTLSLDPLRNYLDGGVMVITSTSRERLKRLQEQVAADIAEVTRGLAECRSALRFYDEEQGRIAAGTEALARQWVHDALADWLEQNMAALLERLDALRNRHERRWFSRALISRVVIISSRGENRAALLGACRELFPGFNEGHSRVVPYEYEPLDVLPAEDRKAARDAEGAAAVSREALQAKLDDALVERNRILFENYLNVVTADLEELRADLVLIEQRREPAFAIVEHLRRRLPALGDTPVIVILPDYWAPEDDQPLPWHHTRVVSLRRLGALTTEECTKHLRALYSA